MKKTILLLLFAAISAVASAQIFSFGAKAGYNTSLGFNQNWDFSSSSINFKNDLANGFHLGLFARVGRSIYVQPEVYYKLSIYEQDLGVGDLPYKKIKASTIDIPVLLGWAVLNRDAFKIRIMAGPTFSINAGSTDVDDYWGSIKAEAKSTRVGLDAGIGLDIWRITVDLRYNLMGDLYDFTDGAGTTDINVKPNNSFALSVGYRIFGNNSKKEKD